MPIGFTLNMSTASVNDTLGRLAVQTRNTSQENIAFFEGINTLGVAGLKAIGFTDQDAQDIFDEANYLATHGKVFFAEAAVSPPFDFNDATKKSRGGQ